MEWSHACGGAMGNLPSIWNVESRHNICGGKWVAQRDHKACKQFAHNCSGDEASQKLRGLEALVQARYVVPAQYHLRTSCILSYASTGLPNKNANGGKVDRCQLRNHQAATPKSRVPTLLCHTYVFWKAHNVVRARKVVNDNGEHSMVRRYSSMRSK